MKKILLIDDSAINAKAVERFLAGSTEYELIRANSGEEGVSILLDNKIDLIFLDIEMPMLDGYDTCLLIKNNELYKDIPLIMVSSRDSDFDTYKGLMYGANDYVTKPYKKEILLEKINNFIG